MGFLSRNDKSQLEKNVEGVEKFGLCEDANGDPALRWIYDDSRKGRRAQSNYDKYERKPVRRSRESEEK